MIYNLQLLINQIIYPFFLSVISILTFISCQSEKVVLQIEVQSQVSLKPNEKIFITGNQDFWGNWKPDAVALKQQGNKWTKTFEIPPNTPLEFKFTKGSWNNEAVTEKGRAWRNLKWIATQDTTLSYIIPNWKDSLYNSTPEITGNYIYSKNVHPKGLPPRNVIVWLPPTYLSDFEKRYPVLYIHDGQNVFDPNTSTLGYDWRIDEIGDSLMRTGIIEEFIAVAIYCNPDNRSQEYSHNEEYGELYQDFLCCQLKPHIDSTYRTKTEPQNTVTLGASMGGLISFIMAWEYPDVFGKAACMSPAFQFDYQDIDYVERVKNTARSKKNIELYIDNGTEGLEAELQPGVDAMMQELSRRNQKFIWFLDEEAEHNEIAWSKRVNRPLIQFFGIEN